MKIAFNPKYTLKVDKGRTLLLPTDTMRSDDSINTSFDGIIHPIHAMILSFANGTLLDETIANATQYLGVTDTYVRNFIVPLINNEEPVAVKYNNVLIVFPQNTIVTTENYNGKNYNPDIFIYDHLELRLARHVTPTKITFMVTNRCVTNCFYCYADRRHKMDCQISLKRIFEVIDEARKLNVVEFDVIGGEFFLYKHWKEVLKKLYSNGYTPFLSTKIPISEGDIIFLKEMGIIDLQISLDTLVPEHLKDILNVTDDYLNRIKNALTLLNKYNIKIYIHTIINSKNDKIKDMSSIYEFIKDFRNIGYWRMDLVGTSAYLENVSFEQIKYNENNIGELKKFFSKISYNSSFPIIYNKIDNQVEENFSKSEKEDKFNTRAGCSGNYSSLFILPDGKVTICEELYWHPQFILGDVTKQTIEEIWNSPKAINLYSIPQEDIPTESSCSNCNIYEKCRSVKQVCYRDIVKEYGNDKWYYPDVTCPKAPLVNKF
jgi:radical SAM protein with 4Fe4S-binding SPASM domain